MTAQSQARRKPTKIYCVTCEASVSEVSSAALVFIPQLPPAAQIRCTSIHHPREDWTTDPDSAMVTFYLLNYNSRNLKQVFFCLLFLHFADNPVSMLDLQWLTRWQQVWVQWIHCIPQAITAQQRETRVSSHDAKAVALSAITVLPPDVQVIFAGEKQSKSEL